MKIEGRNACLEILKSSQKANKVFIANNLDVKLRDEISKLAQNKKSEIVVVDKNAIDKLSVSKKHQGVIVEIPNFEYAHADELIELCNIKSNLFLLMLDGLEDPHNMGSIIRTAECAGVDGVIIGKNRSCDVNETVIRISSGAASHIKVFKVGNINDILREFKKCNVISYCLEADGKELFKTQLGEKICLVVGSEGFGVSRLTRELCDEVVSLPLKGKINSLNASNASAIAIYEALRQREQHG